MSLRSKIVYGGTLLLGGLAVANQMGKESQPGIESRIESVVTGTTESTRQFLDGRTLPGGTKMWNNPNPEYPGDRHNPPMKLKPLFGG